MKFNTSRVCSATKQALPARKGDWERESIICLGVAGTEPKSHDLSVIPCTDIPAANTLHFSSEHLVIVLFFRVVVTPVMSSS